MKSTIQKLFFGALCTTMLSPIFAPAQISEPETIFYGQVINRTSGQLDLITVGNLVWRIARPVAVRSRSQRRFVRSTTDNSPTACPCRIRR
jgi:hypothetical protein